MLHQLAEYRVKASGVDRVKRAIEEFVDYVRAHEPGTRVYAAWQSEDDPTRFVHIFIFENAAAQQIHSDSDAVKKFEATYTPELVSDGVTFTDYTLVASRDRL